MALGFLNRCGFRVASSGAGDFVVASALTGMYAPASCTNPSVVNGSTYRYFAESDDKTQHEEGYGNYNTATGTLARTTILSSSNSGSAVLFSAAPKVFMGTVLAGDAAGWSLWERIAAYDIDANGPFANLDFPIDTATYAAYRLTADRILIGTPASPGLGDFLLSNFRILDSGGSDLAVTPNSGNASFPSGQQQHDGSNWSGVCFANASADVIVSRWALRIRGSTIAINLVDNVETSLYDPVMELGEYTTIISPPNDIAKLRFSALFYDDSLGNYGADPNFVGGKIALYGLRR